MTTHVQENLTPTKPPFWHDPRMRAILFQAIVLFGVIAFFVYIIGNTLHNLEQRGISTGFDFLFNEAGFGIIQTLIEYNETSTYGHTFIVGLLNTLLVSALGIFLATVLGFTIGIARLSQNWLIAKLAAAYIEIFRNIPLLLQIFLVFCGTTRFATPASKLGLERSGLFKSAGFVFTCTGIWRTVLVSGHRFSDCYRGKIPS